MGYANLKDCCINVLSPVLVTRVGVRIGNWFIYNSQVATTISANTVFL